MAPPRGGVSTFAGNVNAPLRRCCRLRRLPGTMDLPQGRQTLSINKLREPAMQRFFLGVRRPQSPPSHSSRYKGSRDTAREKAGTAAPAASKNSNHAGLAGTVVGGAI